MKDHLLRVAAEFENYKKRIERDYSVNAQNASIEVFISLLPILDDLDRYIESVKAESRCQLLLEGIILIQKKFLKILKDREVEPMESIGKKFDPEYHEALMQIQAPDVESNMIVGEQIKGYQFKNHIIRPAKVIVSK